LQELKTLTRIPAPRTALDIELERRFFQEFVPNAIHPEKGTPLTLYKFQQDALHNLFGHQRNLWEWGRQTGKSSSSGLYLAFMSRETRGDAIISSFRHERSKEIVKWARDWCLAHKDPEYAQNIDNDAATHLTFRTGFRIIALPRGESSRGYATRIRIMDESQLINDKDLAAFLPTGLATMPKDLFMGTVWGTSGWWWRFIQNAQKLGYALSQVTSEDAMQPNGPIYQSELERLNMELGTLQYDQECLLKPIPDVDVFFGTALVKLCIYEPVQLSSLPSNIKIIIGFDHAVSGGDESVAWVAAQIGSILQEIETRIWLNTLIHDQARELAQLYPHAQYCIDGTAEGGKEAVGTFKRAGLKVIGVDFGKAKQSMMITLKDSMQRGTVRYADESLINQLGYYKFKESNVKGRYRFGEKGTPDDRVDALALANYFAQKPLGTGMPVTVTSSFESLTE
jgi:hypothetical protein